jgi:hypothetical protein
MSSKTLCAMIRAAVIAVTLCGLAACFYILPEFGKIIITAIPEYANYYFYWLIFLWVVAAPCFAILALIWKVSTAVKRDLVFTDLTARRIKISAIILFCDISIFIVGNILLLLFGMSHIGVLLLSVFLDVFGVSLAVLAAVLSRYITKAAVLQEEALNTI